jgi:sodium/hydrogen antiporter
MTLADAFSVFENYNLWLFFIGIAILITGVLPRLLSNIPLSMPMILLVMGFLAVALPLGLKAPNPITEGTITEHLTELTVIIALMGAGIKMNRPVSLKGWRSTWRLLGITIILSVLMAAWVGWAIAAFVPATAMLLGAVIAPTDPVLAADVQVKSPIAKSLVDKETEDQKSEEQVKEDEVRFALTSEAGLNDGLAFPFTNLAVAMALAGSEIGNWIESWLLVDVLYKLGVGFFAGIGLGYLLALAMFSVAAKSEMAKSIIGLGAIASTLIIYGFTEYLGGYGFLATFIGAYQIRSYEREHEYHIAFHEMSESIERMLTALVLLALGGAIAGGLLAPLNLSLIISALIIVFLVRPIAGVVGLIGINNIAWKERLAISFFGIRGVGSIYYLSFAINEENFMGTEEIWALVALIIVISIFVHGILAEPVTSKLDKLREENRL